MTKNITKFTIACLLLAGTTTFSACTKDFVELNTNPNEANAAAPQTLLAPVLVNTLNGNLTRNFRINNEFIQVTVTNSDSREFHRYETKPTESDYMWRLWYTSLTNIRNIYTAAEKTKQQNYETFQGISLVLDVWVSSLLTDLYGDVPYFEANKGNEFNITPKFDRQEDIYKDLFRKLELANTLLTEEKTGDKNIALELQYADPIYAGNALKWRKFANSLYLRLLLRASGKAESGAIQKIQEIAETKKAQYPVFANNEESAILRFSGILPFVTEYYITADFYFNGDKGYSEFFINNLLALNDPRLPRWSTEASLGLYAGMETGYRKGQIPQRLSTLRNDLKTEPLFGNIINYSELNFILAEAAAKNYISADAKALYEEGVKSNIELWGQTFTADYFLNPEASFTANASETEKIEKIQLQKYFAMIFTDFQQFHEYRRTKALKLYKGVALENNGIMPSRLVYPITTQSYNKKNYDQAVAAMGGDNINVKVWWNQ